MYTYSSTCTLSCYMLLGTVVDRYQCPVRVSTNLCVSAHPPFLMILWFACIYFFTYMYKCLVCVNAHPHFLAHEFQAPMGAYSVHYGTKLFQSCGPLLLLTSQLLACLAFCTHLHLHVCTLYSLLMNVVCVTGWNNELHVYVRAEAHLWLL